MADYRADLSSAEQLVLQFGELAIAHSLLSACAVTSNGAPSTPAPGLIGLRKCRSDCRFLSALAAVYISTVRPAGGRGRNQGRPRKKS